MAEGDSTRDWAREFRISEEKVTEYRDAFNMFDTDFSGTITVEELSKVMANMGEKFAEEKAKKIIIEADTNKNETIEFGEFIVMMEKTSNPEDQNSELERAFKIFDKDGDGQITHSELKEVMRVMGKELTDEQIEMMINSADLDKDKEISLEEFKQLMN